MELFFSASPVATRYVSPFLRCLQRCRIEQEQVFHGNQRLEYYPKGWRFLRKPYGPNLSQRETAFTFAAQKSETAWDWRRKMKWRHSEKGNSRRIEESGTFRKLYVPDSAFSGTHIPWYVPKTTQRNATASKHVGKCGWYLERMPAFWETPTSLCQLKPRTESSAFYRLSAKSSWVKPIRHAWTFRGRRPHSGGHSWEKGKLLAQKEAL